MFCADYLFFLYIITKCHLQSPTHIKFFLKVGFQVCYYPHAKNSSLVIFLFVNWIFRCPAPCLPCGRQKLHIHIWKLSVEEVSPGPAQLRTHFWLGHCVFTSQKSMDWWTRSWPHLATTLNFWTLDRTQRNSETLPAKKKRKKEKLRH